MISGNAMQMLSETGWICDITPPTIIRGQNVNICTITIPAIIIPITLDQGELCVTIGLQGRK
jgi:chemotaxis protein CheX